jgi:hypothetical protein
MIPKEILDKATSGGWKEANWNLSYEFEIICDPSFWQALGKQMGWDNEVDIPELQDWHGYAHRFLNVILSGGSTDKFWKELLAKE